MDALRTALGKLASDEDLEGIYIATADGQLLMHVSGPGKARYGHIQKTLFGGDEEIRAAYRGLDNRVLPQMYAQGEDRAVYSRKGDLLYGLFYVGSGDVKQQWEKSKALMTSLEERILVVPDFVRYLNV